MKECRDCGKPIGLIQNWRGQWVVLDPNPPDWIKQSWVEVSMEHFIPIFRHVCEPIQKDRTPRQQSHLRFRPPADY